MCSFQVFIQLLISTWLSQQLVLNRDYKQVELQKYNPETDLGLYIEIFLNYTIYEFYWEVIIFNTENSNYIINKLYLWKY